MGKYSWARIGVLGLMTASLVVMTMSVNSKTPLLYAKQNSEALATPTVNPDLVKVDVCHKDGNSGNYSYINVSVHSVDDANGLNGHGNHDGDIWTPFTFDGVNYPGQGDYNGTDFNSCGLKSTPTPSVSPTPTATPAVTPTVTPTATPASFVFPSCSNVLPLAGDKAHFTSGLHQVVGGELLSGSDDVYTLTNGNYLQCFCPAVGNHGVQTNWLRSNSVISGWLFENGVQWNLGNYNYAAQNLNFTCGTASPTPTATPVNVNDPNDKCTNLDGIQNTIPEGWYQLNTDSTVCRQFQYGGPESAHKDNPGSPVIEGYGIGGQVLGASTMAETGDFAENFYLAIMTIGATLFFLGVKYFKKATV